MNETTTLSMTLPVEIVMHGDGEHFEVTTDLSNLPWQQVSGETATALHRAVREGNLDVYVTAR